MCQDDRSKEPFGDIAFRYDRWYDTPEGAAVLAEELAGLRLVNSDFAGDWLEIGVGTGRFAAALGIAEGIDPSPSMLALAAKRGIRTRIGVAEDLPYPCHSFDGLLMVAALCFVEDKPRALRQCARVLRPKGTLVVGTIPSDGPWGHHYTRKGQEGHPVYSHARFATIDETVNLAATAGFVVIEAASALFWAPGHRPEGPSHIERVFAPRAGFAALKMMLTA